MVKFLFEIKDLIWLLRLALGGIFVSGIYLETQGTQFFSALAQDHITTSTVLIFLSVLSFTQPFIKVKKRDSTGGVTVMKKLSVLSVLIIGALIVLLYLTFFQKEVLVEGLTGVGGGIGTGILTFIYAVIDSPIYQTYGFLIGGILFTTVYAVFAHTIWPRIHKPATTGTPWAQQSPNVYQPGAPQPAPQPVPVEQKQEA